MNITSLKNYELIQQKTLQDLQSEGYLLRHKKSGARVLLMENKDENKVFSIGFRTPPEDSTGAHFGTFRALRFQKLSGEGSICRIGKGIS